MKTILLALAVPDGSGAPRMALFFGRALRQAGYRVIAVCGAGAVHNGVPTDSRVRFIEELRAAGIEIHDLPSVFSPLQPGATAELSDYMRRLRPDAAIGFQPRDQLSILRACARTSVACIISAQTLLRFWGRWPVPQLKARLFGHYLRRAATLTVCTSSQVQAEYVGDYGVPHARTVVVPNGIPLTPQPVLGAEERATLRREFGCQPDELLLVNVGRIDPQKGQDVLLEAFGRRAQAGLRARLVLVGEVSAGSAYPQVLEQYRRKLDDICIRHGIADRVVFAGWRHDVPRILACSDAYVHSARYEGLPLAVLEALWAGRPTLFTDCCGDMPGFRSGEHAIRVPPADERALEEGMATLFELPTADREQMAIAGKRLVEQVYSIEKVSADFVRAVETVLH